MSLFSFSFSHSLMTGPEHEVRRLASHMSGKKAASRKKENTNSSLSSFYGPARTQKSSHAGPIKRCKRKFVRVRVHNQRTGH